MRTIRSPYEKFLHILFDIVKLIDLYDCTKERSLIKNLTTCITVSPKRQGLRCACKCEAISTQREINREMIGQNNQWARIQFKTFIYSQVPLDRITEIKHAECYKCQGTLDKDIRLDKITFLGKKHQQSFLPLQYSLQY